MSNRNVPFFRDYLRVLGGQISYLATSRVMNISEEWVYKVLAASKAASKTPDIPSVFFFEAEPGDGLKLWFHQHVKNAVKYSIEAIEAAARARALHGTYTTAKFQGNTVYQIDPDLIELGFEGVEAYRRDQRGNPMPEMVWTPPGTDLILGVLGAHARKLYGKNLSVDMNARVSGGVTFAGGPRAAPAISAPLPMVEILQSAEPERAAVDEPAPADFNEIAATDTDPDEPAAPEPEPVDEPEPEPAPPNATGPRIATPTPSEYQPGPNPLVTPRTSGRPLSDLERDLLAKIPGGLSR